MWDSLQGWCWPVCRLWWLWRDGLWRCHPAQGWSPWLMSLLEGQDEVMQNFISVLGGSHVAFDDLQDGLIVVSEACPCHGGSTALCCHSHCCQLLHGSGKLVPACHWSGGGGFSLTCQDFWRMFDHSVPACAFSPPTHVARISPQWLSELRRLWLSVFWRVACELVFLIDSHTTPGQHRQPTSDFLGSRVCACLGVACHLHFWQNDRGLLRASAATRGGIDTE